MTRSLTFLDETGDTTIVWDEDTEDQMVKIIEEKMKQGFVFYLIKPSRIPLIPARQKKVRNIKEVRDAGSVIVRDEALSRLFQSGDISKAANSNETIITETRTTDAKRVATGHAVAVKPARGG